MTDEQKAEIDRLARDAHRKFELVRALMAANIPTDAKLREEQAVTYALARAEATEAQDKLDRILAVDVRKEMQT